MKWKFAALTAVLAMNIQTVRPADACGVKLNFKSSKHRKAISRTSNPSQVLLLGSPPKKLATDLSAAGHNVEVAPSPTAAKRRQYAVVMVDSPEKVDEARTKFGDSIVVVRSGNPSADARSVESRVARTPTRADETRTAVAARTARTPTAAGPTPERRPTDSGGPDDARAEPVTPPKPVAIKAEPERVVTPVRAEPKAEPKPEPKREPEPKPEPVAKVETRSEPPEPRATKTVAAASNKLAVELYFGLGASELRGNGIDKAARWLTAHPDAQVIVAGHADPTGTPEGNMALAQTRAEGVRDALVAAGIDASRIEVVSFGDTRLKYGRADGRNRRVAIEPK
ncbi:MAG: OmpA family protein [Deltaproteobacteria bacterium]|nr:OmpA family protein [Deltaproteobacteria bacterium]